MKFKLQWIRIFLGTKTFVKPSSFILGPSNCTIVEDSSNIGYRISIRSRHFSFPILLLHHHLFISIGYLLAAYAKYLAVNDAVGQT